MILLWWLHVLWLCAVNGLGLVWIPNDGRPAFLFQGEVVHTYPIIDAYTYAVALHEIGHAHTPPTDAKWLVKRAYGEAQRGCFSSVAIRQAVIRDQRNASLWAYEHAFGRDAKSAALDIYHDSYSYLRVPIC